MAVHLLTDYVRGGAPALRSGSIPGSRSSPSSAGLPPRSRPGRCNRAGVCGASASNTSLIVPRPASSRWSGKHRESRARPLFVRMKFQPGIDKRPDQPGPDRSLMIGGVARLQVAMVILFVIGIVRRKRAQPDRREQLAFDDLEHALPAFALQHRMIERDGEDLVRPDRGIVARSLVRRSRRRDNRRRRSRSSR